MTKQEEIKLGIKELVLEIRQYLCNTEFAPEPVTEPIDPDGLLKCSDRILSYLHSQGVVIKHGEGEANLWVEPLIELKTVEEIEEFENEQD